MGCPLGPFMEWTLPAGDKALYGILSSLVSIGDIFQDPWLMSETVHSTEQSSLPWPVFATHCLWKHVLICLP